MPRTRSEDDKKHGDKLESLIERTGGDPSPRERQSAADDDTAELQDDDDEDVQNDDGEDRRDIGGPE